MGNPARSGWVRPARESKQSSRPTHTRNNYGILPPARADRPVPNVAAKSINQNRPKAKGHGARETQAQTQAHESTRTHRSTGTREVEQQALEQWLRRVPDDPGGLLRRKFRYQTMQRLREGEEPDESIRW